MKCGERRGIGQGSRICRINEPDSMVGPPRNSLEAPSSSSSSSSLPQLFPDLLEREFSSGLHVFFLPPFFFTSIMFLPVMSGEGGGGLSCLDPVGANALAGGMLLFLPRIFGEWLPLSSGFTCSDPAFALLCTGRAQWRSG